MSNYDILNSFFENYLINFENEDIHIAKAYSQRYKKLSENSKCFTLKENESDQNHSSCDVLDIISKLFGKEIKTNEKYRVLLESAISGHGNEKSRFTRLHSSSLCAFLHFYKVSKENPVFIRINDKLIEFDSVYFEVDNKCIEGRGPSSIDVVLMSSKQSVILFLESKFAEYLSYGKTVISEEYLKYYNKFFDNPFREMTSNTKLFYEKNNKGLEELVIKRPKGYPLYTGGIKQMLSHYIGVINYCNDNNLEETDELLIEAKENSYKVFLGEMLFDFPNGVKYLDIYKSEYSSLYKKLNNPKLNFEMVDKLLTYKEDLIVSNMNTEIKKFYGYDK